MKKCKDNKGAHDSKGFTSSHNFEILNYFNPDLQLKILKLQLKVS